MRWSFCNIIYTIMIDNIYTEIENIAKEIYSALRKADKIKAKVILIEGVPKKGLGIAIMNRLLRTCEYNCKEG